MNISTGGPHILFFERDQQMATLLSSEFQLAGYECHTARTAVEVFDAIARYSVRILLVNLAQAAAGRREFWVALETQRRGRGVQVFNYQCKNIAGYGPSISSEDADERPYAMKPDIEVDGMLGVVNLLEAVKRGTRSPGSISGNIHTSTNATATTGGALRISATPVVNGKTMQAQNTTLPPLPTTPPARDIFPLGEHTAPLQAVNAHGALASSGVQRPVSFSQQTTMPVSTASTTQAEAPTQTQTTGNGNGPQSPSVPSASEKIRAVIYPGQQSWSRNIAERQESIPPDGEQKGQVTTMESGLAQLSRMIEEQKDNAQAHTMTSIYNNTSAPPPAPPQEPVASWQTRPPADVAPASSLPLRAAPIQDIPLERDDYPYSNGTRGAAFENRGQSEATRSENPAFSGSMQAPPVTPLSVLASMMEHAAPVSPTPPIIEQEVSPADTGLETTISNGNGNGRAGEHSSAEAIKLPHVDAREGNASNGQGSQTVLPAQSSPVKVIPPAAPQATPVSPSIADGQVQTADTAQRDAPAPATAETTLIDIMQSLPPMSSPAPQQSSSVQASVLTGRATRSLGSVLLEGHLVPQDRLEVAQNIQRMLRGVDMNYQLGEILLMFKLLTPDQLLAASLVSYGLLTTAQIRALGRIRQELHSIGLEYDLENLLILFRILSPEQLREVRASWTA